MADGTDRELGALAAGQHGVFCRDEARSLGVTRGALRYRLDVGRYRRIEPGVYTVVGSPTTLQQRIAAAVLSFPGLAAASHQTAAEIWGMTKRGIRVIEVVTTRWDRVPRANISVHESLDLIPEDVVQHDGIPITSPVRTVVDLGASNKWVVESAFEQGIRAGLFAIADVEAFVARVARRGRRGVGVIRPILKARRRWDTATESALEDAFRRTIADVGLPDPETQYIVRDVRGEFVCRADFAYPAERVLIELDSEAHHLDRIAFRRDRSKQNRAIVLGWIVLRFTWWDLAEQPGRVCQEVRAALAARA